MLQRRTDLALEARELWSQSAGEPGRLDGVIAQSGQREGFPVTTVRITSEVGSRALGKPMGVYCTLELNGLKRREQDAFPRAVRALAAELRAMLPVPEDAPVLVAGLGNRAITPDNIGPCAVDHTLVTRHLTAQLPDQFSRLRPVSALCAGVLASTGVESAELVRAVADRTGPACVIAIDALASRSLHRLCTTIQLADTGITPGSGVGNHRAALDRETLGIPVIALGVPTVVDAATLCADVLEAAGQTGPEPEALQRAGSGLMVTPRDIDQSAADMAKVIGYGVSLALQPELSLEEMELLLS